MPVFFWKNCPNRKDLQKSKEKMEMESLTWKFSTRWRWDCSHISAIPDERYHGDGEYQQKNFSCTRDSSEHWLEGFSNPVCICSFYSPIEWIRLHDEIPLLHYSIYHVYWSIFLGFMLLWNLPCPCLLFNLTKKEENNCNDRSKLVGLSPEELLVNSF